MTTAPSSSTTITSPGNTAQPPQPIGCCQPTKVKPLTDAGAATPAHHTGSALANTPARSRIDAVRDQRRDVALLHPCAKDVAKDSGARLAHCICDRDHSFRHVLDRGAG